MCLVIANEGTASGDASSNKDDQATMIVDGKVSCIKSQIK